MAYTTIDKPKLHFNTKLYTGNGGTQSITGVGFAPDWTLLKDRNDTSGTRAYDTVRGAIKRIRTDLTDAEIDDSDGLTAFGSDGFTLGADGATNANSTLYVSWNWKAGGTASSNSDGSITSSVSANTTAGFSIVSWVGNSSASTVGHGLGSVPKMIIVRNRTDAEDWIVYHGANTSAPETDYLVLNLTNATGDSSGVWNDTAPTSSVFSVGTANSTNGSSDNMIAYCFAPVTGFSAMGSYVGNGNSDGPVILTGHKPAMVIIKRTDTAGYAWRIVDNKRLGYNGASYSLNPNDSSAEGTSDRLDFLSNGIKLTTSATSFNASGGTYIYMAFAESPFVNSNGVPNNAR